MAINTAPINASELNGPTASSANAFYDIWQKTVRSHQGIVNPGVSVKVFEAINRSDPESPENTLATIYADAVGENTLGNPFLTDSDGSARFHAKAGFYHIRFAKDDEVVWATNQPLGDMKGQSADNLKLLSGALAGVDFTSAATLVNGLLKSYDFRTLKDCADDASAEANGVPVGALYRTGNTIKTRIL